MINKQVRLAIFILIILTLSCARYYTRIYRPQKSKIEIDGWDVYLRVFAYDHVPIGRDLTTSDSIYTIWLFFCHSMKKDKRELIDKYKNTTFEIEYAALKLIDTEVEKVLNPRYAGEGKNYDNMWEKEYDFGQVSIPINIKNIQLNFLIIVKKPEHKKRMENIVINMHKYEAVKWDLWIPNR